MRRQLKLITLVEIKEVLNYDPVTGVWTWKTDRGLYIRAGNVVGHRKNAGNLEICIDGKTYSANRFSWLWVTGKWPEYPVLRIDTNKGCEFANLKLKLPRVKLPPKPKKPKKPKPFFVKRPVGRPPVPTTYHNEDREVRIVSETETQVKVKSRFKVPKWQEQVKWMFHDWIDKQAFLNAYKIL